MNRLYSSQKGQMNTINGIGQIAIVILIAAVILGLGGTILDKIQTTQTDAAATIPNNQSFTWPGNDTLTSFSLGELSRIQTGTVVVYCNTTVLVLTTSYLVDAGGIRLQNITDIEYGVCSFNMTYAYNFGGSARNATGFGKIGMTTMAEFIPTIAIVAMAAIVIGIILVFFGRKKDEEGL